MLKLNVDLMGKTFETYERKLIIFLNSIKELDRKEEFV